MTDGQVGSDGSGTPAPQPSAATARPTTWIAAGSALNGVAALAFQVVGTRTLGAAGYAPIGVLWTLQYLWVAVAVTALEAYVTRLVTAGGPRDVALARFLRLFSRLLLVTAVVTAVAGVALADALFEGLRPLGGALGLLVLGYGWYGVVRGRAAGMGRFRAYSIATAAESLLRLLAAVVVLLLFATTTSLAWVFPLGPIAVGLYAWLRRDPAGVGPRRARVSAPLPADDAAQPSRGTGRRFLLAASSANAAVQFLLAGGPLVLIPLGADPVSVSVFFTTITAARVPMTFALNGGLSRVLPPLTRLALDGDSGGLQRASVRVVLAIVGLAVVAAAGAATIGPLVIEVVFGADFRPDRAFVTIVAVSTVMAVGGLLLDQIYIAMGRERALPPIWFTGVALALVLVLVLPGSPSLRVAGAFAVGTTTAFVLLSIPLLRRMQPLVDTADQP